MFTDFAADVEMAENVDESDLRNRAANESITRSQQQFPIDPVAISQKGEEGVAVQSSTGKGMPFGPQIIKTLQGSTGNNGQQQLTMAPLQVATSTSGAKPEQAS